MVKINIIQRKDNGNKKYTLVLPKDIMEDLVVKKGDELIFVGEMGGELRFRLKRYNPEENELSTEVDADMVKHAYQNRGNK